MWGTTSACHHLLKFTIGKVVMTISCCKGHKREHLAGGLGSGRLLNSWQSFTRAEQSNLELACYCSWWSELRTENSKLQTWSPHNVVHVASKHLIIEGTWWVMQQCYKFQAELILTSRNLPSKPSWSRISTWTSRRDWPKWIKPGTRRNSTPEK